MFLLNGYGLECTNDEKRSGVYGEASQICICSFLSSFVSPTRFLIVGFLFCFFGVNL